MEDPIHSHIRNDHCQRKAGKKALKFQVSFQVDLNNSQQKESLHELEETFLYILTSTEGDHRKQLSKSRVRPLNIKRGQLQNDDLS